MIFCSTSSETQPPQKPWSGDSRELTTPLMYCIVQLNPSDTLLVLEGDSMSEEKTVLYTRKHPVSNGGFDGQAQTMVKAAAEAG